MFGSLFHTAFIGPGGPEILLVMLVLLLMFGAKDAPRILRKLNDIINQIRSTADGFKREVMYSDLNAEHETYGVADVEEMGDDDHYFHGEDNLPGEDEAVTEPAGEDTSPGTAEPDEVPEAEAEKPDIDDDPGEEDDVRKV